jgi:hypothetical protein
MATLQIQEITTKESIAGRVVDFKMETFPRISKVQ